MDPQVVDMIIKSVASGVMITITGYLANRTYQVFWCGNSKKKEHPAPVLTEALAYIRLKEMLDKYQVKIPVDKFFHQEIKIEMDDYGRPSSVDMFGNRKYVFERNDMREMIECLRLISNQEYICDYFECYCLIDKQLNRLESVEFWEIDEFIKDRR